MQAIWIVETGRLIETRAWLIEIISISSLLLLAETQVRSDLLMHAANVNQWIILNDAHTKLVNERFRIKVFRQRGHAFAHIMLESMHCRPFFFHHIAWLYSINQSSTPHSSPIDYVHVLHIMAANMLVVVSFLFIVRATRHVSVSNCSCLFSDHFVWSINCSDTASSVLNSIITSHANTIKNANVWDFFPRDHKRPGHAIRLPCANCLSLWSNIIKINNIEIRHTFCSGRRNRKHFICIDDLMDDCFPNRPFFIDVGKWRRPTTMSVSNRIVLWQSRNCGKVKFCGWTSF